MKSLFTKSPEGAAMPGFLVRPGNMGDAAQPEAAQIGVLIPPANQAGLDLDPAVQARQSWIRYDDLTWIVASDRTGRKFQGAWTALESHDHRLAELKMRALAADLREWAIVAAGEDAAPGGASLRRAQSASWRLAASALRAGLAAAGLASGEIRDLEGLRRVLDHATVLEMDCRWRFVDYATWYPLSGAPQRHFALARRAAIMQDGETASTEIRKALGFLRLEAARADGHARVALDAALSELQGLANDPDPDRRIILHAASTTFTSALLALALAHRNRAAESWLRGDRYRGGYEFMAAGENLAQALGWLDHRKRLTPYMAPMEIAVLGRRLVAGESPRRCDVLDAIQAFGISVETIRRHIGQA